MIEEIVDKLVEKLKPKKEDIISGEINPFDLHFNVGMSLRNDESLWVKTNPVVLFAKENYGVDHADDISGLIIEWAIAKTKEEEFDPVEHCKKYIEHWERAKSDQPQVYTINLKNGSIIHAKQDGLHSESCVRGRKKHSSGGNCEGV